MELKMSKIISKNLLELLYSLIQNQINDETSKIIKEILNAYNLGKNISKRELIKKVSLEKNSKESDIIINKMIEKLIDLDYVAMINENLILKIDNILNILLYPRYCYYINSIYGPKCLKVIEYLLEFGFYCIDNNENKIFSKNDFDYLVRDGIIIKNNIKNDINYNKDNNNNFKIIIKEIYKINYNLLNNILFKEYIINFYKQYISMNFQFYELFKKIVNNNFSYELKNSEKSLLDDEIKDNYDYDKLLIKDNNKVLLNLEIIKYDLFYNSIEKIINVIYSSKYIRILKIIQRFENLNIYQISQKACLKPIEVEEIINDLINNVKIVKKLKIDEINKNNNNIKDADSDTENIVCLKEIKEYYIDEVKDKIFDIITNIKFELKDKLKELQGRISKETEIQYINKYYSLINSFSEIINCFNFLFINIK